MLYQMEVTGQPPHEVIDLYYEMTSGDAEDDKDPARAAAFHPFAEEIVNGVYAYRSGLDAMIVAASENWRIERMSIIDRNVLRIALYEMLYCPEIPPKVSINEAIDLGKTFGSPDSGAFINGILDHLLPEVNRTRQAIPGQEG